MAEPRTSGQTTLRAAPGEWDRQVFQQALDILADPRNAWLGLGFGGIRWTPKAAINAYEQLSKLGKWHDWINTRYNRPLIDRPPEPVNVGRSGDYFQDIINRTISERQPHQLSTYLNQLEHDRRHNISNVPISEHSTPKIYHKYFEGTVAGKAAYDAVSRQVSRMLDEVIGGQRKLGYGPPPPEAVPWSEYRRAFPRLGDDSVRTMFEGDERALWDSLGFELRPDRDGNMIPMRAIELPSGHKNTAKVWVSIKPRDNFIDEPIE